MVASGHEDQCFMKEAQGSEQDWRSIEDDTTAAPGPAQSQQEADVMDVEEDATATPGPSQPLFPELEEEEDEDEVLFREKADDDGGDEGVISDYESEAEMSQEMVLDKLEKFLL